MISYEKTTNAFHDGTQAYECSRISQDDVNSVSGVLSFISFTVDTVRRLPIFSLPFKVTPDLRGVLREKIRMRAILKETRQTIYRWKG